MQVAASSSTRLPKYASNAIGSFRKHRCSRHQLGSSHFLFCNETSTTIPSTAMLTPNYKSYSSLPSSFVTATTQNVSKMTTTHTWKRHYPRPIHHRHFASASLWDTFGNVMDGIIPSRTNPILDFVQTNSQKETDGDANPDENRSTPNFSNVQARHIEKASIQVLKQYEEEWNAFDATNIDPKSYKDAIVKYHQMNLPLVNLMRISHLMKTLCGGNDSSESIKLSFTCDNVIDRVRNSMNQKEKMIESWKEGVQSDDNSVKEEHKAEFRSLQIRLRELEKPFLSTGGGEGRRLTPRKALPLMYELLSTQCQLAELLDKNSYAESQIDKINDVESLHQSLISALQEYDNREESDDESEEMPALETGEHGFELRKYLKLDSVLDGLFLLSRNLFGVMIVEVPTNEVKGWHQDVKLYHMYNEKDEGLGDYLGSFYMDLFKRVEKDTDRAFTSTLLDDFAFDGVATSQQQGEESNNDGKKKSTPLLCVNCNMTPPLWDDSPAYPSFDDVQELFHEFGHVLHGVIKDNRKIMDGHDGDEIMEEFLPQVSHFR